MNVHLPETGFVRLTTILKVIPVGKSTWWEGVRTGRFPPAIKLSPRVTAWRAEDIHTLIKRYENGKEENAVETDNENFL
jgi:prophage regulatory protein